MTNLNDVLEIIFSGFVVRTREEMKPFETLVNKRISFDRIEQENFKEIFESKVEKFIKEQAAAISDSIRRCCRFARELSEKECEVKIEIVLDSSGAVELIPGNFLSAVVAKFLEWKQAADCLAYAVDTAKKHLFPTAKEAEKEVKE